jgi:hypothetical protein
MQAWLDACQRVHEECVAQLQGHPALGDPNIPIEAHRKVNELEEIEMDS